MKTLSGNSISGDILKKLWLQRLPQQVQVVLTISTEPLDNLSIMADKILETYTSSVIAEVSNRELPPRINPSESSTDWDRKFNELRHDMMQEINKMQKRTFYPRNRNRSKNRPRSSSRKSNTEGLCYYHNRFAEKARKCTKPCTFQSSSEN
ncbi:hypothetical protein RI129_009718 [Pyrocoelia pectoralis]|uniref:Gag protein n=1 Tax=Pyrocoelia pectoralis TaxID=417401 RepID=A0AAN7V905_9COLE